MPWLVRQPWIWAYLGAFAVWLATTLFAGGQGAFELLSAALTFGTFFVIVGIGQMFVVTLGPGNVDLSIPATMTLAGTVSMKLMDGADAMLAFGFLAAIAIGIGVGIFNYGLIRLLRIPPIIATLSSAFVFQSAAIWYNRGPRIKPPPALADFTRRRSAACRSWRSPPSASPR
jgi:ribose transport system permease protein